MESESLEQALMREEHILRYLEDITSNASEAQEQVLRDILVRNAHTEYLHRFELNGCTDATSFRNKVPVIQYEDIAADIQRLVDGDTAPILSCDPPVEFLTSSGTSKGVPKVLPKVQGDAERHSLGDSLVRPVLSRQLPGLDQGLCLYFLFSRAAKVLPTGLLAHPVTSSFYRTSQFRDRPYEPSYILTSPDEVTLCTDTNQAIYCHLLLGLLQSQEVLRVGSIMASTMVRVLRFLEKEWQTLCEDIASGTVGDQIQEPALRHACEQMLTGPNPDLASRVRRECETGIWTGIIPRLWPNTKVLDVITTGVMEAYIPTLKSYAGHVRLICNQLYAASEGYFGINMNPLGPPDAVSYTLIPTFAYLEFLPMASQLGTQPVQLADVKVGQEYELVITNYAGLYRYRMGDVLRCTGHYNKAPSFYIVGRTSGGLSIDFEKTTDRDLQNAMGRASKHLQEVGLELREYSSYADSTSKPVGHYVIFWEVSKTESRLPSELLDNCCSAMEECFDILYCELRHHNVVGPLELRIVKEDTFEELANLAVSQGANFGQYKPPRSLRQQAMIDLLNSYVCQTHFSATLPVFTVANYISEILTC